MMETHPYPLVTLVQEDPKSRLRQTIDMVGLAAITVLWVAAPGFLSWLMERHSERPSKSVVRWDDSL